MEIHRVRYSPPISWETQPPEEVAPSIEGSSSSANLPEIAFQPFPLTNRSKEQIDARVVCSKEELKKIDLTASYAFYKSIEYRYYLFVPKNIFNDQNSVTLHVKPEGPFRNKKHAIALLSADLSDKIWNSFEFGLSKLDFSSNVQGNAARFILADKNVVLISHPIFIFPHPDHSIFRKRASLSTELSDLIVFPLSPEFQMKLTDQNSHPLLWTEVSTLKMIQARVSGQGLEKDNNSGHYLLNKNRYVSYSLLIPKNYFDSLYPVTFGITYADVIVKVDNIFRTFSLSIQWDIYCVNFAHSAMPPFEESYTAQLTLSQAEKMLVSETVTIAIQ